MLEKLFKLTANRTNIRTEVIAGVTTFMTMAYIIFVQPAVLSVAGMNFGAVMMATCISAAIATFLMGLYANYPIALAPAMGENFFYVYTVVLTMGIPWQTALGAVFLSGVAFFVLTLFKIRELIIDAVPRSLKNAIAVGIGFFITFIGLVNAGIIEKSSGEIVRLGEIRSTPVLLSIFGILLTVILMIRKVKGAILIGIIATALVALPLGIVKYQGLVSPPPSLAPTFMQMDIMGAIRLGLVTVVTVFLFMAIFDAIGTLIGIGEQAGFLVEGKLPRANRALMSDALGTVVGAALGTSTVTAYIESAAGVEEGGRTGLANVITGFLFLLAIFFSPLAMMIGGGYKVGESTYLYPITSPALIIVGCMMAKNITKIAWDDLTESFPAFLTMIGMPLTYSIADGLAFGFISYPLLKALSGKFHEISWLVYLLGLLFLLRYALIAIH
ncbi:MAG: NCS2 family permease [Acidobacteriota bacterium]